MLLKQRLGDVVIPALRSQCKQTVTEYGKVPIASVLVEQVLGGARGLPMLWCETSRVSPEHGLTVRGIPIRDLAATPPIAVWMLMLTGTLPAAGELAEVEEHIRALQADESLWHAVEGACAVMPNARPMNALAMAILSADNVSSFSDAYHHGAEKSRYWETTFDDSLKLLAMSPMFVGRLVRGELRRPGSGGWGDNIADLLFEESASAGSQASFRSLCNLYLTLHSDHEMGNVSAHTAHLVGSALSSIFQSAAAGLCGLAGPLHGGANTEAINWLGRADEDCGEAKPADMPAEWFEARVEETLRHGTMPGFGHAVLRKVDPRFLAFHAWGGEHIAESRLYQVVDRTYQVATGVCRRVKPEMKDPYPNVDFGSGPMLNHFGIRPEFHTLIFGLSRLLGMTAAAILSRAVGEAIERPGSITLSEIRAKAAATQAPAAA